MSGDQELKISSRSYEWSLRLFSTIKRLLRVNIKLHDNCDCLAQGQIFLFNHFARFETFIPQYLIHSQTGAYCRSVAAAELFSDLRLGNYLRSVGAVPNNHPEMLYFLAKEILRGRKVVVFPEGGMVKDRRVLDRRGRYSIYSRSALSRRKHHAGAAVLGLVLDAFKTAILDAHMRGARDQVQRWVEALEIDSLDQLLHAALEPTLIIPANITFYPLRVDDNVLRKGVEAFSQGISARATEELLVEGNILFKDTDMDIRLGRPVRPIDHWRWWERMLFQRLFRHTDALRNLLNPRTEERRLRERLFRAAIRRNTKQVRDLYMGRMYEAVTINLNHLASTLIMRLIDQQQTEIEKPLFFRALFLALKGLQACECVNLHRSLRNPGTYRDIFVGNTKGVAQFLQFAIDARLLDDRDNRLHFLPKLREEHDFDQVRLENPILVYANEAAPVRTVNEQVQRALKEVRTVTPQRLAELYFDDELRTLAWNQDYYQKPRYAAINDLETASADAAPFLMRPQNARKQGVVLVHGFLSSPAEVRPFAEVLTAAGYPVVGVRLSGHGTSPYDLRERSWSQWLASVRRGYNVLTAFAEEIYLVGFSTGGALSLLFAAEQPHLLKGLVSISAPMKFRNRNLAFVPLVHGANRLLSWTAKSEGVMPFRPNEPEHPHINYRHIPIRGLYELRRMTDELHKALPEVQVPALIIQGDEDPVVDARSAAMIADKIGSLNKSLVMVKSDRHGILYENIGETQETILEFLQEVAAPTQKALPLMADEA